MSALRARLAGKLTETDDWIRHNCNVAKIDATIRNLDIQPQTLIYGVLAVVTLVWLASIVTRRRIRSRKLSDRPSTPDIEKRSPFKAPAREPGGKLDISPLRIKSQLMR